MALFVIGDTHGHSTQVTSALREAGLIDASGDWAGADDKLWFLGDLTDRGPDGIGVIELIMRLQPQAAAAGGEVGCVLGNHDLLLYGSHYIPDARIAPDRTIFQSWTLNGGRDTDLEALTDRHLTWLAGCPAVALVDDHLLVHADTTAYLEFGTSIEDINKTVGTMLAERDPETFGPRMRLIFRRFEFLDPAQGPFRARMMLEFLGGSRIVHGHSTIPETFQVPPPLVDGPVIYADGLVVAVDTGIALGAPCLVVPLS
ncbi:metallophosphoesterase [Hamadaea tsunoensis]|uniref:metallophosphoesterase n=1 Tax=Hamadaea tsunoensis TaxID=53368 RepID=UPI000486EC7A|nr:metallophosphoesterase [Hamadaea tsunoensis]